MVGSNSNRYDEPAAESHNLLIARVKDFEGLRLKV